MCVMYIYVFTVLWVWHVAYHTRYFTIDCGASMYFTCSVLLLMIFYNVKMENIFIIF